LGQFWPLLNWASFLRLLVQYWKFGSSLKLTNIIKFTLLWSVERSVLFVHVLMLSELILLSIQWQTTDKLSVCIISFFNEMAKLNSKKNRKIMQYRLKKFCRIDSRLNLKSSYTRSWSRLYYSSCLDQFKLFLAELCLL